MSFNYRKRFQELKSQLPDYNITYRECTSKNRAVLISRNAHFFLINWRREDPTFHKDLTFHNDVIGFLKIQKSLLRYDKDIIIPHIKQLIEDSFNDAIQRELSS